MPDQQARPAQLARVVQMVLLVQRAQPDPTANQALMARQATPADLDRNQMQHPVTPDLPVTLDQLDQLARQDQQALTEMPEHQEVKDQREDQDQQAMTARTAKTADPDLPAQGARRVSAPSTALWTAVCSTKTASRNTRRHSSVYCRYACSTVTDRKSVV